MRALVVVGDPVSAKLIEAALRGEGIISDSTEIGADATELITNYDYDIIILDPGSSAEIGFELIHRLRSCGVLTPTLFLLHHNYPNPGKFVSSPDDYITKPFHKGELIARVRSIADRSKIQTASHQRANLTVKSMHDRILALLDTINESHVQLERRPQHPKIFLAHAREDKAKVRKLYEALKSSGFDPWLDEVDLLPGQNWKVEIERAIKKAGIFLACLSSNSVAKQGYVQTESKTALSTYSERPANSIYIIPIKLDDCEVQDMQIPDRGITLRDIHWVELSRNDGFQQLLKAIKHAFGIDRCA